jgi:two-component system, NarL family, nitrate/nitrite response regulator NarL
MPVKIMLVDDHEVVRRGLRTILSARPEWQICGEAENGKQAVDMAVHLQPDVIILDVTMPVMSGLEATQELRKLNLERRVLIFTMHDAKSLVRTLQKAGAGGYVIKSRAAQDLIHAVEALLDGGSFYNDGNDASEPKRRLGDSHSNFLLCRSLQFVF